MGDLGVQISVRPSVNRYTVCLVSAAPVTVLYRSFLTLQVFSSYYEDVHVIIIIINVDRTWVKLMSHLRKMTVNKVEKRQKLTAGLNPNHMHILKPEKKMCKVA